MNCILVIGMSLLGLCVPSWFQAAGPREVAITFQGYLASALAGGLIGYWIAYIH